MGQKWELRSEIAGCMTKVALEAVESERLSIGARLRANMREIQAIGAVPGAERPTSEARQQEVRQVEPQSEIMHITGGVAAGWSIRCTVTSTPKVTANWDVREPQGLRWKPVPNLWQTGINPVICKALQEEITAMAARIGQPIRTTASGSGRGRGRGKAAGEKPAHARQAVVRTEFDGEDSRNAGLEHRHFSPGNISPAPSRGPCSPMLGPQSADPPELVESMSLRGRKRFLRADFLKPAQGQAASGSGSEQPKPSSAAEGVGASVDHFMDVTAELTSSEASDVSAEPEVEPGMAA